MARVFPAPGIDDATRLWLLLTVTFAGCPDALARRVWQGLARHEASVTLRYHLTQAVHVGLPGSPARQRAAAALVQGPGRPSVVMAAMEAAVEAGTVARHDATVVEERLLALVDRQGAWK